MLDTRSRLAPLGPEGRHDPIDVVVGVVQVKAQSESPGAHAGPDPARLMASNPAGGSIDTIAEFDGTMPNAERQRLASSTLWA